MKKVWGWSLVLAGCLLLGPSVRATVLFDLDTGTPGVGSGLPFDQTAGGITAHFSSPSANAFSLQSDGSTQFHLSQFSGKYIYPNNQNRNHLQIAFSRPLASITITFATIEYQDNAETPDLVLLTARSGGATVGTASARGAYLGDTYPMGSVTYNAGTATFDNVDVYVPFNANGCTDFLADNIIVQTAAAAASGSVPDGATVPGSPLRVENGIGGAINLYWSASCMATDVDYAVYEGVLGDFTSHLSRVCSTSGATSTTIVPSAGNAYYLVVPHNGSIEGSYGVDSASAQRPASLSACFPQAIGACP